MLVDQFDRKIDYIRFSLTDKCNLRCRYCRGKDGVEFIPHEKILSLEKILEISKIFVERGIRKIRLTGGEPLVRKNILWLVDNLSKIENLEELCMTTNGVYLEKYAQDLFSLGLSRVNISLDTLDAQKYKYITRGGNLENALKGIRAAQKVGFDPIKINTVLVKGFNDSPEEIENMQNFCIENNLIDRYIKEMKLTKGVFTALITKEKETTAGVCKRCNKLRITCDGKILPCLFSDNYIDISSEKSIYVAIKKAIEIKPKTGHRNSKLGMIQIGG